MNQEKTVDMPKAKKVKELVLAFNVKEVPEENGMGSLWCTRMYLVEDGKIIDERVSNATSFGHAISAANNLLDLYSLESMDDPKAFFDQVGLI